jgi:4-hydroxy-2-oxoglutarate aldolase
MTESTALSLAGVFPPIPTPFTLEGEVAFDQLHSNLERWNAQPLSGYVVGGSNGEFVSLTHEERIKVVQEARQAIPKERLLIAGSGTHSTRQTITLTEQMAQAGADAAIVVTPSYYRGRMTPAAFENHYSQLAENSPLPIILYNVPANTAVDLPLESISKLAQKPQVVGIKESGGSVTKIGAMVHRTPDYFQVLAGSAGFMLGALSVGAVGVVAALANIAAESLVALHERFQQGDIGAARDLQLSLIEINTTVTVRFGVAGLKAAMDFLGYYGGPVRSPLLPLEEEEKEVLREILVRAALL